VSANGYQIVVNTHQAHARTDVAVANIQGKLSGHGMEEKLPTVAIVAHYDSYGVAPVRFTPEKNTKFLLFYLNSQ